MLTADDVRKELQAAVDRAGAIKLWGYRHGFSQPFVSNVLAGRRPPSARLCKVLGIRKTMRRRQVYEHAYERARP